MNLVLFDLDNTLLNGDTDVEWLEFLAEQGAVSGADQEANRAMDRRYASGEADPLEYVRFYLSYYAPHDMDTLLKFRKTFLRERIEPRMLPAAKRLVRQHDDDLVAIITATNRFLTEPIAAAFGIEHLIATEPEIRNGRFTGEIVGAPCMRNGKVARLDTWLAAQGRMLGEFKESWFYSDSINDLPLLERVSNPVAVDPDAALRDIAERRGWPTLTLRDTTDATSG